VADTVLKTASFIRVQPGSARPQSFGRGWSSGEISSLPWLRRWSRGFGLLV